ncbi:MAG: DUF2752 domain-containing protein [Chitinophagaceae bacterium]
MILINFTSNIKTKYKIYGIVGALITLAIPYFIMLNSTGKHLENEQSYCPFKMLTGFPCPGCGITKSLINVYQGNIIESLYFHLFGPLTFLFCITVVIVLTTELITKKEYLRNIFYSKKLAYFWGISLAIYHLIRLGYFIHQNSLSDILKQSIWK